MAAYVLNYREVGLTPKEVSALLSAAQESRDQLVGAVGEYSSSSELSLNALKKAAMNGTIEKSQIKTLFAVSRLCELSELSFNKIEPKSEIDSSSDFYTKHPSFGCIDHSFKTSNNPSFVGSASMSSRVVSFLFSSGYLYPSMGFGSEPSLSDGINIISVDLAGEQYSGLVRNIGSGTPCCIGRRGLDSLDVPPSLLATQVLAEQFSKAASEVVAPLTLACLALMSHLGESGKVSTAAEYAAVHAHIERIQRAVEDVKQPLNDLFYEAAGVIATASINQIMLDIMEPLKALGFDVSGILSIAHSSLDAE